MSASKPTQITAQRPSPISTTWFCIDGDERLVGRCEKQPGGCMHYTHLTVTVSDDNGRTMFIEYPGKTAEYHLYTGHNSIKLSNGVVCINACAFVSLMHASADRFGFLVQSEDDWTNRIIKLLNAHDRLNIQPQNGKLDCTFEMLCPIVIEPFSGKPTDANVILVSQGANGSISARAIISGHPVYRTIFVFYRPGHYMAYCKESPGYGAILVTKNHEESDRRMAEQLQREWQGGAISTTGTREDSESFRRYWCGRAISDTETHEESQYDDSSCAQLPEGAQLAPRAQRYAGHQDICNQSLWSSDDDDKPEEPANCIADQLRCDELQRDDSSCTASCSQSLGSFEQGQCGSNECDESNMPEGGSYQEDEQDACASHQVQHEFRSIDDTDDVDHRKALELHCQLNSLPTQSSSLVAYNRNRNNGQTSSGSARTQALPNDQETRRRNQPADRMLESVGRSVATAIESGASIEVRVRMPGIGQMNCTFTPDQIVDQSNMQFYQSPGASLSQAVVGSSPSRAVGSSSQAVGSSSQVVGSFSQAVVPSSRAVGSSSQAVVPYSRSGHIRGGGRCDC